MSERADLYLRVSFLYCTMTYMNITAGDNTGEDAVERHVCNASLGEYDTVRLGCVTCFIQSNVSKNGNCQLGNIF